MYNYAPNYYLQYCASSAVKIMQTYNCRFLSITVSVDLNVSTKKRVNTEVMQSD